MLQKSTLALVSTVRCLMFLLVLLSFLLFLQAGKPPSEPLERFLSWRCGCSLAQRKSKSAVRDASDQQTNSQLRCLLLVLLLLLLFLQAGKPPAEPLERFLAELEMRLQLGAEEVEGGLSEVCGAALRRVPFALQEVGRLRGDVGALQVGLKR